MVFAFLGRWFRGRPTRHVIVYTRADCPLCDEAITVLEPFRQRGAFTLETRDVDASADWVREFGDWVPVVVIDGAVRFRGHVNEALLRRLLDH